MDININNKYIDELPDKFKIGYLEYQRGIFHISEQGSTHQPLLIHVVNTITDGDIVELGMGDNSTPLLHLLCEKLGRKLHSYDFDKKWCNEYSQYESDFHKISFLDEAKFRNNEYPLNTKKNSIMFIDSHPGWTRKHAMTYFKDSVDYFIIHDTTHMVGSQVLSPNNYDFSPFKNVLHFTKVDRTSTLFTDKEISKDVKKIFQ